MQSTHAETIAAKFFALFATWLTCATCGAAEEFQAIRLSLSDLLPHRYAQSLKHDRMGALWVSTESGFHRFDGSRLETLYKFKSTGYRGNPFLVISSLVEDAQGGLWLVHSSEGLHRYNSLTRSFEPLQSYEEHSKTKGLHISSIYHDGVRTLWVALEDGTVIALDTATHEYSLIFNSTKYLSEDDYITALLTTSSGRLFMASSLGSLLDCNAKATECIQTQISEKIGLNEQTGIRHLTASADKIYIGTVNRGAFRFDPNQGQIEKILLSDYRDSAKEASFVTDLASVGDAGVWIGTQAGLFFASSNNDLVQLSPTNSDLESPIIHSIEVIDKDQTLVSTVGGVYLIEKSVFEDFSTEHGLRSNLITTLKPYQKNQIFVGTYEGLDIFEIDSSSIFRAESRIENLDVLDPRITAVYQQGSVTWLGFFEDGLYKFENFREKPVKVDNPDRKIVAVSDIVGLESKHLAIATQNSGVHLISPHTGEVISALDVQLRGDPVPIRPVFTLDALGSDVILAGAVGGIYRIQLGIDKDRVDILDNSHQLQGIDVLDILESSTGFVWIGTKGRGLYKWDQSSEFANRNFLPVSTSPSMPSDTIYAMEEDDLGLIWLATNSGLVRLNPSTQEITIYGKADGLLDNDFNLNASLKDKEGHLYFGGFSGFNRLDPRRFINENKRPPVRLIEISVSNQRMPRDPIYDQPKELVIQHDDKSLDFEFSTMDIVSPERSQYKYILDGFDTEWTDNGNRNSATFTNLPPGDYIFRVIGANSNGSWNYDGISLPVKVLTAPWLSWWAVSLYYLAGLTLIVLIKRFYDARLLNTKASEQVRLMTNMAMLAMDDLQDQLLREHQLVGNLRRHTSQALDSVENLLHSEAQKISDLEASKILNNTSSRLKCLKALESAIYFHGDNLEVNFHDTVDRLFADLLDGSSSDPFQIVLANEVTEELLPVGLATPLVFVVFEIIQNSLDHAFTGSKGVQCIHVKLEPPGHGNFWLLQISDTGCGLPKDIDPLKAKSTGMKTIRKLVKSFAGSLSVRSASGTKFTIKVPINLAKNA